MRIYALVFKIYIIKELSALSGVLDMASYDGVRVWLIPFALYPDIGDEPVGLFPIQYQYFPLKIYWI